MNLTPETNVNETYYAINNGPVYNVSVNGQPVITTEGASNTLEYWSTWNMSGTIVELPHTVLTGIQLQKTPPQGSLTINGGTSQTTSASVTLTVNANSISGASQMRFSNDGVWDTETWQPYASSVSWQLNGGDDAKTVYCQIEDNAGFTVNLSSTITLSTPQTTVQPTSSPSRTVTPNQISLPSPSATPTQAPELNFGMIIILFFAVTFATLLIVRHHRYNYKAALE